MKDRVFKIISKKLNPKSFVYYIIDSIKEKELENKNEFYALLKAKEISEQEFIKDVYNELHKENQTSENLNDIIRYLGKDGIGIFPDTWFTRNVSDKYMKKIDKAFWKRLRSPKWLSQYEGLH